jgi:Reverse transcriptase (RNA-dependent DNA polymerase)
MEPVDLDLNELLGTHTDRADRPATETDEHQGHEQPQETANDAERPQEGVTDDSRPQGASEGEVPDEDTIVVDSGAPDEVRNDPQRSDSLQGEGAQEIPRRSGRERRPAQRFEQALATQDRPAIPTSYEEAINDPVYGRHWKDAVEEELIKLQTLDTWEFADLPDGKRPVGCKWVFTVKYTPTGLLDRFKARLVAQGYSQVPGDDFLETFSPTVRFESLRTLLAIGAYLDWEIHQTDVVSAYPRSILHAEVYMKPPQGLQAVPGKVLRVKKSLYGLKQSGREWYLEACKGLEELGLYPIFADTCIFVSKDQRLIVGLYVDDMVILADDIKVVQSFKAGIAKRWEIKDLGEVKRILGLEITRDRAKRTIKITQTAYTDEMIAEYGLADARETKTPSVSLETLEPTSATDKLANVDQYRRVIGKLLYLMRGSRPDICFTVSRLSRYVAKPAEKHWRGAMQVLKYVKGTRTFGISFSGLEKGERIEGYVDSDYAGDRTDRRSTYGSVFMLLGGLLAWYSRKQRLVSTLTTEAEYVALC